MSTRIRVGVLGCADVARRLVIPAMKLLDSVELVAVASRDGAKAQELACLYGCDAIEGYKSLVIRKDIDLVYVPLPTGLHSEWAMECLERGKHVLVEKSMSTSLKEAKLLVDCARRNSVLIKENYMFAYHHQQRVVRDLIRSNVGSVRVFRANFGFPPLGVGNIRYDAALGGGALLDCGGYVLKAVEVFFPEASVIVKSASLEFADSGVDISGAAMLMVTVGERSFPAQVAFGFDHRYQCSIEVWGSDARLYTDRSFTAGPSIRPNAYLDSPNGISRIELPTDNHFRNLLEHSVALIRNRAFESEYAEVLRQAGLQEKVRNLAMEHSSL